MVDYFQAFILGIIQAITEWFPVSSSGHLVLFQQLFGMKQPELFLDAMLHLGTVFSVIYLFRGKIARLIKGTFSTEKKYDKEKKQLVHLVIASVPIFLVGYYFHEDIALLFASTLTVGLALIVNGFFLLTLKYVRVLIKRPIDLKNSIAIGIAQALAIIPGISRSGITLTTALNLKIKKDDAIDFVFLLSIPAIVGAAFFETLNVGTGNNIAPVVFGTIVAAVVGYFALKFVIHLIKSEKYYMFAYYCFIVGLITVVLSLV